MSQNVPDKGNQEMISLMELIPMFPDDKVAKK